MFSSHDYILFFHGANMAITGMWAIIFFFGRRIGIHPYADKHPANPLRWWSGVLALCMMLSYLYSMLELSEPLHHIPRFSLMTRLLDMCIVPVCGMLLLRLCHAYRLTPLSITLNELPFIAILMANIIWNNRMLQYVSIACLVLYVVTTLAFIIISAHRYEALLRDRYASVYGRSLMWLWRMVFVLLLQVTLWVLFLRFDNNITTVAYYAFSLGSWNFVFVNLMRSLVVAESSGDPELEQQEEDEELLIRFAERPIPASAVNGEEPLREDAARVDDFLRLLDEVCIQGGLYMTEDLTRDMLARKMNIGHTMLTTMLRRATGKSFYEYINSLRVARAAELLTTTDMDVADIGFEVGYRYRSTFYRAFSAQYGCTPAEWRKQN